MVKNDQKIDLALNCFLLAGKIMMESGAETYRVEDTMLRMAKSQNFADVQSYATPTGIILSIGENQVTKISSIHTRITDLHKITLVNNVSRKLSLKIITLEQAYKELLKIQNTNYFLPMYVQVLAASIVSGCFLILFGGLWKDIPASLVAGGVGFYLFVLIQDVTRVKFFSEFMSSLIVGLIAILSVKFNMGVEVDKIIIGSVMPLVPGLVITNAIRDLMAGHFTAGVAKGTEAFLTAFAIGSGIAIVLSF